MPAAAAFLRKNKVNIKTVANLQNSGIFWRTRNYWTAWVKHVQIAFWNAKKCQKL